MTRIAWYGWIDVDGGEVDIHVRARNAITQAVALGPICLAAGRSRDAIAAAPMRNRAFSFEVANHKSSRLTELANLRRPAYPPDAFASSSVLGRRGG